MSADGLGQIASAPRAQVRPAPQRIGGEFSKVEIARQLRDQAERTIRPLIRPPQT